MNDFQDLASLPGTALEQSWVRERLETLSEWEGIVLAAVTARRPPATALDAANCLLSLENSAVFIAPGGYEGLGEHQLRAMAKDVSEELLEYVDLYNLGKRFEDKRPGLFIGDYYVAYPLDGVSPVYSDQLHFQPDDNWSVRLKLASPAVPEGLWLRVPEHSLPNDSGSEAGEAAVAMRALQVHSLDDCTLLETRCSLPEIHRLVKQYDSIQKLVRDAGDWDNIRIQKDILTAFPFLERLSSYASSEEADTARQALSKSLAGRGPEGLRHLRAAMEYEDCAKLNEAVEIAARLDSYEFMEISDFRETAKQELLDKGLDKRLVDMCFNFEAYAAIVHDYEDLYSSRGTGLYVHRNDGMSQPEQGGSKTLGIGGLAL